MKNVNSSLRQSLNNCFDLFTALLSCGPSQQSIKHYSERIRKTSFFPEEVMQMEVFNDSSYALVSINFRINGFFVVFFIY